MADDSYDEFDPDDYMDATPRVTAVPNKDIRRLRQAAKERDTLKSQLDQLQRESAMYRAGIPDSALGRLFIKAYDGDVTDPAQIRAAAIESGIISEGSAGTPQDLLREQAIRGTQESIQLQTGASGATDEARWQQELNEAAKSGNPKAVAQVLARRVAAAGMDELSFAQEQHTMGLR